MTSAGKPGFFGKVRTEGDFVRRRMPQAFLGPWETWLEAGMAASRAALGEDWLATYLGAPVWHFALSGGICGELPAAGVLLPSVDCIGRHFPFSVVAPLPSGAPAAAAVCCTDWFERSEALALTCLDAAFDLDTFDRVLSGLMGPELDAVAVRVDPNWRILLSPIEGGPVKAVSLLVHQLAESAWGPYSLWWSEGGGAVRSCLRLHAGLLTPSDFSMLLGVPTKPEAAA